MTTQEPPKAEHIRQLCAEGYLHYDQEAFKTALRLFYQAWLLLPKPQSQWPQAGWILTAIGDAYFRLGQFTQGLEALESALHCNEIDNNPFVHLRLGQCHLQAGDPGTARRHLLQAYEQGGRSIFAQEDPKYLRLVADLIEDRVD